MTFASLTYNSDNRLLELFIYGKEILLVELFRSQLFLPKKGYLNTSSSAAELIRSVELLMVYIYPALFSSTLPMSGLTLVKKKQKQIKYVSF